MSVGPPTSIESWEDLKQWLLERMQSHYSVEEFAALVKRAPFTVREWCRLGRLNAEKSMTQAGPSSVWTIPASELDRFRREGLLPRGGGRPMRLALRTARRRATS
jgi:hypothetical protein